MRLPLIVSAFALGLSISASPALAGGHGWTHDTEHGHTVVMPSGSPAMGAGPNLNGANPSGPTSPRPGQTTSGTPWMTVGQVADLLSRQGMTVRSVETEHGRYEVEGIDTDGRQVDLSVDPINGQILSRRWDD